MFNIIGVILILILPTVVVKTGIGNYADGVRIMGWAILIALPVTIGLAMVAVPEPMNVGAPPHGGPKAYLALFGMKTVRKLLIADLLLGVAPGITGSLLFFFFGQIKGYDHTQASLFMLFYFVAGLVGAPIWAWLATRIGKDRALAVASLIFAGLYIAATLVPGGNFALTAVVMFIAGLPYAAGLFLLRAMMADAGDEVRLETGRGPHRPDVLHPVGDDQDRPRRGADPLPDPAMGGLQGAAGTGGQQRVFAAGAANPVHRRAGPATGGGRLGAEGLPLTPNAAR